MNPFDEKAGKMKIPVFVSSPTMLNKTQSKSREIIISHLDELNLEPRALGRSDYPTDLPLREVHVIAKHCAGGIILGFGQFSCPQGVWKSGTSEERSTSEETIFPSPWNHLEAGILYSLGLPLLVFKEDGVSGGVFDHGVSDVFVHQMPNKKTDQSSLKEIFLKWRGKVNNIYYS